MIYSIDYNNYAQITLKLKTDSSKGTLRKESGKIKPLKRNIARILTRLNELKKK